MNKTRLFLALLFCLPTTCFFAQSNALQLTLRYLPDGERWGVFVKPDSTISPTTSTYTGSGQATIVMPLNYLWGNLVSHSGTWSADAIVHAPAENPNKSYVSFGMVTDGPNPVKYSVTTETLLFTIKKNSNCPDTLYLFENGVDPFEEPNGIGSNPGNDLSVVDYGHVPFVYYQYKDNYDLSAWHCDSAPNPCAPPLQFYLQPASASVCSFSSHVFTAFVANPANLLLQYQWQISANGGITWSSLTNNATYSGAQTNQLSIFSVEGLEGRQFRLVVSTATCQTMSEAAVLTVNYGNDCVVMPGIPNGSSSTGGGIKWDKTKRQEFGAGTQEEPTLLTVFPNPADQQVFAKFQAPLPGEQAVLRLRNAQGIVLQKVLATENETMSFDLENLSPGFYLLTFEAGGKILGQEKFVKR